MKAKVKTKVTFKSIITIVVPWLIAVISSLALIGVNQTKYADYIRKVKPDNAFVSTVTVGERVVIRCVSFANCYNYPVFYPTNRCGMTYLTVTEEGKDFILFDEAGIWQRRIADITPPVTEEKFCEKVKEVHQKFSGDVVIADTPFDMPIMMRSDKSENLYPAWEFTYFIRATDLYVND